MIDRVLIAGLGSIGLRHLRLLRQVLPKADIRVLRRALPDVAIQDANGCFDQIKSARDFAPDLSVIANPAPLHVPTAMALAEVGSHLLLEKPVSDKAAGVSELITLCASAGRILQVGYNLRFLETLQLFRDSLAAGLIGDVFVVRCEIGQYLPDWRVGADYRDTVSAQKALGGGVLLELSHELDMLRWVFGEVEWLSAWTGRQSALDLDVEDCVMLQMGYAAGAVAQLAMDFLRRDTTRICTAVGEHGSLRWNAVSGQVAQFDPDRGLWTELRAVSPDRDFSYRAQIDALLTAIAGCPGDIAAQGCDGLAVMQLIEAARESDAQQGRRVMLRAKI